jgi:hypothetical protein
MKTTALGLIVINSIKNLEECDPSEAIITIKLHGNYCRLGLTWDRKIYIFSPRFNVG